MTFAQFIRALLIPTGLQAAHLDRLVDPLSLPLYEKAFTHVSADPVNNYEVYEQLGDITVNKFLVWYFHQRFSIGDTGLFNSPFGVKVIARLRIKYGSKQYLAELAERLHFWPHIRVTEAMTQGKRMSLLEDVLESFIGVTEYLIDQRIHTGLGYRSCYTLLQAWFDPLPIDISYEQLFDAKTRLKELFDVNRDTLGTVGYEYVKLPSGQSEVQIYRTSPQHERIVLSTATSEVNKAVAEQLASEEALTALAKQGFVRDIPVEYKRVLTQLTDGHME